MVLLSQLSIYLQNSIFTEQMSKKNLKKLKKLQLIPKMCELHSTFRIKILFS